MNHGTSKSSSYQFLDGGADVRESGGNFGMDREAEFEAFVQDAGVLTHFLAGEQFGERIRRV